MCLINELNDKQKEAVLQVKGPVLMLAGAGSGKTRAITTRIAYMIAKKYINPYNIMAITFTNKASKEMKERIKSTVGAGYEKVWVATFHSTCVRILRQHADKMGISKNFVIYDSKDQKKLVKECLKELNIDKKQFTPKAALNKISTCKNELITPLKFEKDSQDDYKDSVYAKIYKLYQKKLKSNDAMDFDDLIFKTVELFRKDEKVLESYQDRFRYIMVDEYQDTNTAQYQLIKLLADKYKNLCVVGDDDQSIYKWRGANINNILNFEKDFKNTKVVRLEQNYRSTQNILEAANKVVQNNTIRKDKKLWTDNDKGELIKFYNASDDKGEAKYIVDKVKKEVAKGKRTYNDFTFLYRTNAQSRIIEEYLVRNAIPYTLLGGTKFYRRLEILDILAYLRIVINSKDDIGVKRIINVPKRGIGKTTIGKVNEIAIMENDDFYNILKQADKYEKLKRPQKKIFKFVEMIEDFKEKREELTISKLVEYIVEKIGYIKDLEKENSEKADDRIDNIRQFISKAVEFENENPDLELEDLLEEIALMADIDNYNEEKDRVKLMTIHSSKGLEFPVVFITGFEENVFPSYRSVLEGELEEERRLCYVAMTRAEEELYITAANSRLVNGKIQYNSISKFFEEIPEQLIQKENKKSVIRSVNKFKKKKFKSRFKKFEMPKPKNIKLEFEVGDLVKNMKYGKGTIKDISPAGADYEICVDFKEHGEKKMMSSFSKLKKLQ